MKYTKSEALGLVANLMRATHKNTLAVNTHSRLNPATCAREELKAAKNLLAALAPDEIFSERELQEGLE